MENNFKFGADQEYQENYKVYYTALSDLIKERAKITKASVAERAGRGRSAIKPSRAEFISLIADIEAARQFVSNDPDALKLEKLMTLKSSYKEESKLWKDRYTNLLAVNISLLVEVERLTERLQNHSQTHTENDRLRKENSELIRALNQSGDTPKLV